MHRDGKLSSLLTVPGAAFVPWTRWVEVEADKTEVEDLEVHAHRGPGVVGHPG